MARTFEAAALVATALCLSSLLGFAYGQEQFSVIGKVYCDTCRVDFETKASYGLADSKVRLECHNRTSGVLTLSAEAVTDKSGEYKLVIDGDHEEEICELQLVESSDPECSSLLEGAVHNARVALTNKNGVAQAVRYANPLAFTKKESLPNCKQVLIDMGVFPLDLGY
ncbi:olee1-like protein [Rhodamnia argentea]|uniref:Olee1-like protein n=1 Tax=Rhodamnia argentea TaxID=178133 RepID=A0A8B8NTB4_9MYRT|nr:olee1-like protein [Rhodamnia argentea]